MGVVRQVDFVAVVTDCGQVFVSKRGGRPSVCGWLCLGIVLVILAHVIYRRDNPSGINPKFKDSEFDFRPGVPQPGFVEFLDTDEITGEKKGQNKKSGIMKVPLFNPNQGERKYKPPSRQVLKELEKYGAPKPKLFPVEILEKPRLTCEGDLLMLMLVHSSPDLQVGRNATRHTWGRQQHTRHVFGDGQKWLTIYVMGKSREPLRSGIPIREENAKYGDILQGDFYDTPYEDTRKFMLGMAWLVEYIQSGNLHNNRNAAQCRPRFVLKTQSNIFHNMPSVVAWLEHKFKGNVGYLYMGHLLRTDTPVRDPYDPLYVSPDDYLPPVFPDIVRGPVYLFSYDAFVTMHGMVSSVIPIAMEDAYVGLLADNAGIKPHDNDHFHLMKLNRLHVCDIVNNFFFFDVGVREHKLLADKIRECRVNLERSQTKRKDGPPVHENL